MKEDRSMTLSDDKQLVLEDSVSLNNMSLNARRLDCINEQRKKLAVLRRGKGIIQKPYLFLKHFFGVGRNGWPKTKLLLSADLNRWKIQDFQELRGFDRDYELGYRFLHNERPRIAVYTSIFGDYDSVKEPFFAGDSCDFYIITDADIAEDSKWSRKTVEYKGFSAMDGYHKSKWCKMHPHILFPEYDYSIWVDGNIQIVADLAPLVDRLDDSCSMGTFQNPLHDCIYTESNFCIYYDAVDMGKMLKQVEKYQSEGFPHHFGMREFSIIVRHHHDSLLMSLMDEWWAEVNSETMRDQISFPYLLWKNGLNIDFIQLLGGNWRENPRFICDQHNRPHVY